MKVQLLSPERILVSCILIPGATATHIRDGKGTNEGGFSEEQLQMYKDCFKLMDINKDGTIDKMTSVVLLTTLVSS